MARSESEQELQKLREKMVEYLRRRGIDYRFITCDNYPHRYECTYAYDPYNIDGDCLAEK